MVEGGSSGENGFLEQDVCLASKLCSLIQLKTQNFNTILFNHQTINISLDYPYRA